MTLVAEGHGEASLLLGSRTSRLEEEDGGYRWNGTGDPYESFDDSVVGTRNFATFKSGHHDRMRARDMTAVPPISGSASPSSLPVGPTHATFLYPNGDRYVGDWDAFSRRHGNGCFTEFSSGNKYDGDWHEDERHGNGIFTSGGLDFIYDGEWLCGERTGFGKAVWADRNESYTGEWKCGRFHGKGKHCFGADGQVYDGEWREGLRHGVGTLVKEELRFLVVGSQYILERELSLSEV